MKVATSQFPVSKDIHTNRAFILQQIAQAADQNAAVVHFPEGALSGYPGVDMPDFEGYDWDLLNQATREVMAAANKHNIFVLLGSSHPLSAGHKPHNSLYIINYEGQIIDRYDKRFCAGLPDCSTEDLKHYSPGDHFSIFEINGITCSTLICHEYRYPELYRQLKSKGVQVVFHSFHAANMQGDRQVFMEAQTGQENHPLNPGKTIPEITMPATLISNAANNYLWISSSNSSAAESCFGSFMVRPDGVIIGKLEKNKPGVLLSEIDPQKEYYDSTKVWRERAMKGILHSGEQVEDSRSKDRKSL
ncbi:MAG: carbon-nitrogen hydrolase family protein [Bacteroidetes bacterium]|nr:carbon-nitrogen hydrolase family protein [Bacteroidota bacterium]